MALKSSSSQKPSFNKDLEHLIEALVSDAFKAATEVSSSVQPEKPSGDVGDLETLDVEAWLAPEGLKKMILFLFLSSCCLGRLAGD